MPETVKAFIDKYVRALLFGPNITAFTRIKNFVLSRQVTQLPETLAAVEQAMNDVRDRLVASVVRNQPMREQHVGLYRTHTFIKTLRQAMSHSEKYRTLNSNVET